MTLDDLLVEETPGGSGVPMDPSHPLTVGQRIVGRVCLVPVPGRIGISVDVGLSVPGFVDVLALPDAAAHWPVLGTVAEFEVVDLSRDPQVRLHPVDARYRNPRTEQFLRRLSSGR